MENDNKNIQDFVNKHAFTEPPTFLADNGDFFTLERYTKDELILSIDRSNAESTEALELTIRGHDRYEFLYDLLKREGFDQSFIDKLSEKIEEEIIGRIP